MKFKLFGREIMISASTSAMPRPENDDAWQRYLQGQGFEASADTALKVAAVFRCVSLISETIASLPLHMMRSTESGAEQAKSHALYGITHMMPNEYTTAYEFWQMFTANLLLTEGGYAKIKRDNNGFVTALWNIPTRNIVNKGTTESGRRFIDVTDRDGNMERLMTGEFMFVPNFRFSDDESAEEPIRIASEVLGITQNLNRFAGATFKNGVNPGGFLEIPGGLSDKAYERLKNDFTKNYAGVANQGKFVLLEEGAKAQMFTRDLEKTQALESRKFAISEICRMFGVPPHLCMDMEHATFSNIEQQSMEFVRDCLNPRCIQIEQALYRDLLGERERKRYYWKFNLNGLLRADTQARKEFYNAMRQNGIMNADEIRALEDMNAIEGGLGQTYYINGNMLPLENAINNAPRSQKNGGN